MLAVSFVRLAAVAAGLVLVSPVLCAKPKHKPAHGTVTTIPAPETPGKWDDGRRPELPHTTGVGAGAHVESSEELLPRSHFKVRPSSKGGVMTNLAPDSSPFPTVRRPSRRFPPMPVVIDRRTYDPTSEQVQVSSNWQQDHTLPWEPRKPFQSDDDVPASTTSSLPPSDDGEGIGTPSSLPDDEEGASAKTSGEDASRSSVDGSSTVCPTKGTTPELPDGVQRSFDNGFMTFYKSAEGACGFNSKETDFTVCISGETFHKFGSQTTGNPICGRKVCVHQGDKSAVAMVNNICHNAPPEQLDMSIGLFTFFQPVSKGIANCTWEFI